MTMKKLLIVLVVLFSFTFVNAQTRTITGKVSSAVNPKLEGATVQVKGTSLSTTTDGEGKFSIAVPSGVTTLVFSYVGYQPVEVDITRITTIDIVLKEKVNDLNDVIVVGYGTARKRDVTGSVASINTKDLEKTPVIRADQMLQGRVSG